MECICLTSFKRFQISNLWCPIEIKKKKKTALKYLFNNVKKIIYAHTKFRVSNLLSCTTFSNLSIKKKKHFQIYIILITISLSLQLNYKDKRGRRGKRVCETHRLYIYIYIKSMKNIPKHVLHDWILNYKNEGQFYIWADKQLLLSFIFFNITLQVYLHTLMATFKVLSRIYLHTYILILCYNNF